MKRIVITLAFLLPAVLLFGQNNIGADYYYLGEYAKAKNYLERQLSTNPAEANFYLGEIAFAQENPQKAKEFYDKALAADPAYFKAQVGLAKLMLKSNPGGATAIFKELSKKNKNNAELAVAIGRAYLDNGMLEEASAKVADARKYNKSYPWTYILEGDIAMAAAGPDHLGSAAGKYEQARYFDSNFLLSYMKLAQVYEKRNTTEAVQLLQTAREIDPNYVIVYGVMGKIYTSTGYYPEAIEALKIYFDKEEYSANDLERMARAYYFGDADKLGMTEAQKLAEAEKYIEEGFKHNPDHFVLNRYKMYLAAKAGDCEKGIAVAKKFFKLRESDSTYIQLDCTMYGNLLMDAGDLAGAVAQYDKAIEIDPCKLSVYEDIVARAREIKDYGLAAKYYQKLIDQKKATEEEQYQNDMLFDLNSIGNLCFQSGTVNNPTRTPELIARLMQDQKQIDEIRSAYPEALADSLKTDAEYFTRFYSKLYLTKAEAAFKGMIEAAPQSYTGYYYMARTQNALLPGNEGIQSGLPKQYYQNTVDMIESRESGDLSNIMTRALRESYGYLAYYYYMTDDNDNAVLYSNKVLELDPQNANAKAILDDINSRK